MSVDLEYLQRSVAATHCLEMPTRELLSLVGRQRFSAHGWQAVLDHLAATRLEATRLPSDPTRAWVYHRESAIAMTLEAVLSDSPRALATLQSIGMPPDESDLARNLADILRWAECSSLEEVSHRYSGDLDVDDAAINFEGEDAYSFVREGHGRLEGVTVNDGIRHIHLAFPFDPLEIPAAFDELDRMYNLEIALDYFWEEIEDLAAARTVLEFLYVADLSQPAPWAAGNKRLELTLVTRDDRLLPVARFLRSGEILFRLGPGDVADVVDRVRIYKSRGPMRVVAPASDLRLCADLMLRAAL